MSPQGCPFLLAEGRPLFLGWCYQRCRLGCVLGSRLVSPDRDPGLACAGRATLIFSRLFGNGRIVLVGDRHLDRSATDRIAVDDCCGGWVLLKRRRQVGDPGNLLIIIFRLRTWFLQESNGSLFMFAPSCLLVYFPL